MISFALDEELHLIKDTVASFARERLYPIMRASEAAHSVDTSVIREFHHLGIGLACLPPAMDGLGLGQVARMVINEELAAADPGAAIALDRSNLSRGILSRFISLEALLALNSLDHAQVVVIADDILIGSESKLTMRLAWAPINAPEMLILINNNGICLVQTGFHIHPLRGAGLRAAGACEVTLNEAPLAHATTDPGIVRRTLAESRLYAGSLLLGCLRQGCDFSREYARQRQAFGKPIAHHQALGFLIVDMQMALEAARLLLHDAALCFDNAAEYSRPCASALVECIEAAAFIGPNVVQILGGSGFMQDYPVEKVMRESCALSLWMGGLDSARRDAAEDMTATATEVVNAISN